MNESETSPPQADMVQKDINYARKKFNSIVTYSKMCRSTLILETHLYRMTDSVACAIGFSTKISGGSSNFEDGVRKCTGWPKKLSHYR